jgi:hypothetical protein
MKFDITHEGRTTLSVDREGALALGYPVEAVDTAVTVAARDVTRENIKRAAGDPLSLLGTTADAAAIATLGIATLTVAVAGASSYADFKTAYLAALGQLGGDHDMVQISGAFLAKIEAGEVIIPAMVKGMSDVIGDIESRSTAVAQALVEAAAQGG